MAADKRIQELIAADRRLLTIHVALSREAQRTADAMRQIAVAVVGVKPGSQRDRPQQQQQRDREQRRRPAAPPDTPALNLPTGTAAKDLDRINAVAKAIGDKLVDAFQRGRGAVLGLVEAASPSHFATFTGSVELLSSTVGSDFLPTIDAASKQVQQWAAAYERIDPQTRQVAARTVALTVALGGAVAMFRLLYPLVVSTGLALRNLGVAATATPVGRVVALGASVAALALAWRSVTSASKEAATAQGEAGRVGVGDGPAQPGEPPRPIAAAELQRLPDDVRQRVAEAKTPEATKQALAEYEAKLQEQRGEILAGQPQAIREAQAAQQRLRDAADREVEAVAKMFDDAVARFTKRTGKTPEQAERGGPGVEKFAASEEVVEIEKRSRELVRGGQAKLDAMARDAGLTEQQTPRIADGSYTGRIARPTATQGAGVGVAPNIQAQVQKLDEALRFATGLRERAGAQPGGDDMLRSLRGMPQSRFTDAYSFQESVQTTVLNTGDLEAKQLQQRLDNLNRALGSNTKAIEDAVQAYQRSQTAGAADTFLRGWIDLSR